MPPKTGASDEQLYWWRVTMALALVGTILILTAHMAWSVGMLPFFEGAGFVQKHEFQALAANTKQARVNTLMSRILDVQEKLCGATGDYRSTLSQERSRLLKEWADLHSDQRNGEFPLPSCEDMGIR